MDLVIPRTTAAGIQGMVTWSGRDWALGFSEQTIRPAGRWPVIMEGDRRRPGLHPAAAPLDRQVEIEKEVTDNYGRDPDKHVKNQRFFAMCRIFFLRRL